MRCRETAWKTRAGGPRPGCRPGASSTSARPPGSGADAQPVLAEYLAGVGLRIAGLQHELDEGCDLLRPRVAKPGPLRIFDHRPFVRPAACPAGQPLRCKHDIEPERDVIDAHASRYIVDVPEHGLAGAGQVSEVLARPRNPYHASSASA